MLSPRTEPLRLQELLRPEDLLLGLEARDKWDAIDRMMDHLKRSGRVPEALSSGLLEAVLARERSMSTGMERGLAIPHAAVDELESVVACLAVIAGEVGLQFESIDGSPTRFIVMLLIPRPQKLLHIRTLADVARVLGDEGVRNALRAACSADEAWHALGESERGS